MLENCLAIFKLEFLLLLRRAHEWLFAIAFFFIVIMLFPLALSSDPTFLKKIVSGGIWIATLLSILLSVENLFFSDLEDGSLEQCLLSNFPLPIFVAIKLLTHWVLSTLPIILALPVLGLLFHLTAWQILLLSLSLLMTTPLITALCCLGIALTIGLRQQGVMLGLMILPLAIPLLIFGVSILQQAENNLSLHAPFAFLAGISILGMIFFPWVIAETLRMSLEE